MTADNVTVDRVESLLAALDIAYDSLSRVFWQIKSDPFDPAEAASIVNETIANLTNEAR